MLNLTRHSARVRCPYTLGEKQRKRKQEKKGRRGKGERKGERRREKEKKRKKKNSRTSGRVDTVTPQQVRVGGEGVDRRGKTMRIGKDFAPLLPQEASPVQEACGVGIGGSTSCEASSSIFVKATFGATTLTY